MKVYKFTMSYDNRPYTDSVILPIDHNKTDEEICQIMMNKFISWRQTLITPGEITAEPFELSKQEDQESSSNLD
jgi:hypothetical protein